VPNIVCGEATWQLFVLTKVQQSLIKSRTAFRRRGRPRGWAQHLSWLCC